MRDRLLRTGSSRRRRLVLILSLAAVTLALSLVGCGRFLGFGAEEAPDRTEPGTDPPLTFQNTVDKMLAVGDKAPDFTLSTLEGEEVSLREIIGDELLVLEFGSFT